MGIRREAAVLLAALGALAASTATAWAAAPPLHVEVGEIKCVKLDSPLIPENLKPAAMHQTYPTVQLTMRSTAKDDQRVGYAVTVDGTVRAAGEVTGSATSSSAISIDNNKASRLVVTSGGAVVVDRILTGRC
ncbi:hypothetical protein ABT337_16675 [Saccharopolyspora hirsuta]|uniref:Uncharacterized protein n=1 Tax=Saccharopolyspora hirsuta TaxID=1837 RepID=A0A5M7BUW6_SACHI|nr:hypothetical protein [Saccharopolyspora hirsuta]KAA5833589.1 hypothetical protein F1721_15060 [Saccharopolyspora hirsuta]